MDEWDGSGDWNAAGYSSGPVRLEFVDAPALNGEHIEWSFRTVGGATAPSGTVTSHIAVMTHDHNMIRGGTNKLGSDLGPHDVGGGRFNPVQYTANDGDYYATITVGDDVKNVSYRVHERRAQAT
jgi:hypothetical protein